VEAIEAWREIARALMASGDKTDRDLAGSIANFVRDMPMAGRAGRTPEAVPARVPERTLGARDAGDRR
jgi:hypothetical protein